uniref:Uncharacterized protein n=1 Tax=Strombidium inclinatum TaxID=197538 RepID=A0A7S3IK77_9SPIT|eukprot:CAMPEP_0170484226 /NCGR_PEP_ID=MMETSP0208-20121228/3732_1 /TAXON_ID=197538 /ORGANISM="Strombidium inclinatum, Strain S3" /LENGTH=114 /DNA_ID=CAMNT_0010757503 /DNA_START=189 /DNA_END=533 /DNA_ORIENTATION=+
MMGGQRHIIGLRSTTRQAETPVINEESEDGFQVVEEPGPPNDDPAGALVVVEPVDVLLLSEVLLDDRFVVVSVDEGQVIFELELQELFKVGVRLASTLNKALLHQQFLVQLDAV